jgi:cytochrome c oxidase subunit IV
MIELFHLILQYELLISISEVAVKLGVALAVRNWFPKWWLGAVLWFALLEAALTASDVRHFVEASFGSQGYSEIQLTFISHFMNSSARIGHVLSSYLYVKSKRLSLVFAICVTAHCAYNYIVNYLYHPPVMLFGYSSEKIMTLPLLVTLFTWGLAFIVAISVSKL